MEKVLNTFTEYLPDLFKSFWSVILAILLFFIGKKFIKLVVAWSDMAMKRAGFDKTAQKFLTSMLKVTMLGVLIYILADFIGIPTASILALIGSAGLAIGLALQGSLSNFAGGVLLLALKPFTAGDYIIDATNGIDGTVESIELFYTKLITPDNKTVFIPNGTLANTTITNFSAQDKRRLEFFVNIGYESNLQKAKEVILSMINNRDMVVNKEHTVVFVERLAESSIVLGVRCWVPTAYVLSEKWAINEQIKLILDENNITIAFNKLDVNIVRNR